MTNCANWRMIRSIGEYLDVAGLEGDRMLEELAETADSDMKDTVSSAVVFRMVRGVGTGRFLEIVPFREGEDGKLEGWAKRSPATLELLLSTEGSLRCWLAALDWAEEERSSLLWKRDLLLLL